MAGIQKISPCLWFDGQGEEAMQEMMTAKNPAKSGRVMNALLKMKKLDLAALQKAYDA